MKSSDPIRRDNRVADASQCAAEAVRDRPARTGLRLSRAASVRVGLEFRGREVKHQHTRLALDLLPSLNGEVQNRDRAGRIFGGQALHFRLGARAGQRGRQFAEPRIVSDQSHAPVRVDKRA
jgi:hypothetical protein